MDTVLLFPETSISSFIINLPSYIPHIKRKTIIMDQNDYQRTIRLSAISKEYLFQAITIENLIKTKLLKVIDYRKYYSKSRKISNLKKINHILSNIDDSRANKLTLKGYEGWLSYTKNENKKIIYESLDEVALKSFLSAKDNALQNIKKLGRGGGDLALTRDYIQRLLTKSISANSIANSLNQKNFNVRYILEGPEYDAAVEILSSNKLINKNIFLCPTIITMNSFLEVQKLIDDIIPEILPQFTLAKPSSYAVGSSIGSLMHLDLDLIIEEMNASSINYKILRENVNKILEKIKKIDFIEKYGRLNYFTGYIGEVFSQFPFGIIKDLLSYKLKDLQISDNIYELKKDYLDSEVLIAITIFLDPLHKTKKDELYYDWRNFFIKIFRRTTKDDMIWLETQKDMTSWALEKRWYEV